MSTELKFKRPGGVYIEISSSVGNRIYVSLGQMSGFCFKAKHRHLATMHAVLLSDCELVEYKGRWSLDVRDVSVHFEPNEAQQLRDQFGFNVRHLKPSTASTEAQPCHS